MLVPLLSLVALWAFAASVTLGAALEHRRGEQSTNRMTKPLQQTSQALEAERQVAVMYISAGSAAPKQTFDGIRARTDGVIAMFRKAAKEEVDAADDRGAQRMLLLQALLKQFDALPATRSAVEGHSVNRLQALDAYNAPIDALFEFSAKQTPTDDGRLHYWASSLVAGGRAVDMVMRESALVAGAQITGGRMSAAEQRYFAGLVAQQRMLWAEAKSDLDPKINARTWEPLLSSSSYTGLKATEEQIADAKNGRLGDDAKTMDGNVKALLGGFTTAALENSKLLGHDQDERSNEILTRLIIAGGLGLIAVLASILVSVRFGRGLVRELVTLRASAQELAERQLPGVVARLIRGEKVDVAAESPPPASGKTTEVAKVAEAFASVQRTAVQAAVGQADLRNGVSRIFLNIARRNQSLLHRQLAMLDSLESRAEADDLDDLFRLDHLTTRMRRHAESLIILSGATPGRGWRQPVRISDVLRGAVAEVEDYTRVAVLTESEDGLLGAAVTDVIHLLAELVENACSFSPPSTEVRVMAERVGSGFVVEVEDRGLGVRPDLLDQINRRLGLPPEFDLVDTDQLGLFVVARLAARHNVKVSLRPSPYGGTTAIVLLPHELVVPVAEIDAPPPEDTDQQQPAEPSSSQEVVPLRDVGAMRRGAVTHQPADSASLYEAPWETVTAPQQVPAEPPRPVPMEPVPPQAVPSLELQARSQAPAAPVAPAPAAVPDPVAEEPAAEPAAEADEPSAPLEGPWGTPETRPALIGGTGSGAGNPWFDELTGPEAFGPPPQPTLTYRNGNGSGNGSGNGNGGNSQESPTEPAETTDNADTYAGLPRRRRQENLAPQLRADRQPTPPAVGESAHGVVARSPEEARSLMSSIQQGWRRGRAAGPGDSTTGPSDLNGEEAR
ncbi:nitrate- and nitrite sensing domain-containing protein [Actinomadura barringtoniae]|uniref:histidine kinase n=1 Tax=Actinomadura barringtoniae TaxID=1427535 RepID=A0A939PD12_9ACTN|nr:sensor histidine kinase [Actinomadura barringtoniae]MBO2450365.1 nitrate- and nitrite sensing domain-containing protein [Actinomadura barringtoniae]